MKRITLTFILFCVVFAAAAQKGYLRGKVTDVETGEPLIGATISRQGTTTGTVADFDGNFSLALEPGTHTIVFQFVSYQTKTVENVEIASGEVNQMNIALGTDVEQLAEVVVTAELIKDSEVAVLTLQRKSANVLDGMSSQTFKKIGDSNLSGAIKRVTGVSVQGGKYVYVRGLGDRYTRTTLNGLSIPGLDPERNDVQIDLFPTNVLENVLVYKTFTPDLTGDFTGGVVDVETKSFPEEKVTSVSVGFGYNPQMHFNDNFLTYDGGKLDLLGIDDGTRKLPFSSQTVIPLEYQNDPELERLTRSLNPAMEAKRKSNFMNTSFSFNHGNQVDKDSYKLGYSVILNYQRQMEYYENAQLGSIYFKDVNRDELALDIQRSTNGDLARENVLWSGLISGAIKTNKHQLGLNVLHSQNGIASVSDRKARDVEETGQTVYEDILTYTQRSITNFSLSGKHHFDKLMMEWGNSFTLSRVYDPDFRLTSIVEIPVGDGQYEYSTRAGQGGNVGRFWRDLNESNENFKADFTYTLAENNKLKAGILGLWKWRTFNTYNYLVETTRRRVENDPSALLKPENIWTPETTEGTYLRGNYEPANNYDASSGLYSVYAMHDILIAEKLRAIYGARVEKANMFYTGQNRTGTLVYDNEKTLDELNILPAVNLVYNLSENINIRSSYGRTLARPSFKEKSIAQILDPITGILFNGNINLEQTIIDNYDLRFENFFGNGEMFSISGFYKKFDGHIELTRFETEPRQVTPRNIGGSYVYGVELEARKNLDFIANGISAGTNISLAQSSVDMTEVYVDAEGDSKTEYESRAEFAREGETQEKTRGMAGQAPYLINAFINYTDNARVNNINLSYNVQGENIAVVGVGQVPDVYSRPFHSLNLNASRKLGIEGKSKITIGVDNLLGDEKEEFFKNHGGQEETFTNFNVGRTFSVSYSHTF